MGGSVGSERKDSEDRRDEKEGSDRMVQRWKRNKTMRSRGERERERKREMQKMGDGEEG
jgi:hypothetical protein